MGFLRRVFGGGGDAVPEWAPFDDGRAYRTFVDAVAADLTRRGLPFAMGDGVVHVTSRGAGEEPDQYGLSNLSQLCHANPQDEWPRIIASHFTSLLAMQGRDLDALAADYDQVRPILRVRLMPDESMGGVDLPESVARPVAPGMLAVLVYDFPDSTATVHVDHLASWPIEVDGAFEQAVANLDLEPKALRDELEDGDARVTVRYGDGFYVASDLLRLESVLPPDTPDALVAVPNRHTLLLHPVRDATVIESMDAMYRLAVQLFREGPGSISDQPYWWHEGRLTHIPHLDQGSKIAVIPPDDFLAVLERAVAASPGAPS